jgi:hypothetical protein
MVEPAGEIETLPETDGEPVRETVFRVRNLSRRLVPTEYAAVVPRLEEAAFGAPG